MIKKIMLVMSTLVACFTTLSGASPVVINEVELNPMGEAPLWVELYNVGDEDAEIDGWIIYITSGEWAGRLIIPAGTVISPGEFYVKEGKTTWAKPTSGSVTLRTDADEIVDSTPPLTDSAAGEYAWSRYPDGTDTDNAEDWGYVRSTKGSENLPLE